MIGEAARRTGDVAAWWSMDPSDRLIALREARERLRPGLRMTTERAITPPVAGRAGEAVGRAPRASRAQAPVVVHDGSTSRQATPQEEAVARRVAAAALPGRIAAKTGSPRAAVDWWLGAN